MNEVPLYSQVDILGVRYKSAIFREPGPDSLAKPNHTKPELDIQLRFVLPHKKVDESVPVGDTSFENNYFTEMCSGSEAGSYLKLIYFCITQL